MNLSRWLAEGRLRSHRTTKQETRSLLEVAERDLRDAAVQGLSSDRQFLIAYEAALTLATIPLYSTGYETHGQGHHWLTFKLLPDVMGREFGDLAGYFDQCRAKRNIGTYDRGGQISLSEAEELVTEVERFRHSVEAWLKRNYPNLV